VAPTLSFRVAYAPYYDVNAFIDSLKVFISSDCGASFQTIFRSGGEALSTTSAGIGPNNLYETAPYSPRDCEEWRDINLDLSLFEGKYVTIKILNQSGYGNNMYLDDLALTGDFMVGTQVLETRVNLRLSPNPTAGNTLVQGNSSQSERLLLALYNATGQKIWERSEDVPAGHWQVTVPSSTLPSGIYWVKVMDNAGRQWSRKLVRD
jgi:Secretion system C-terminal sorting domain